MNDTLTLCPDEVLAELAALAGQDPAGAVVAIDRQLVATSEDSRLHFLKGSLLIGLGRFVAAHQALSRAVSLDPSNELMRFQLGFFELTSGEAAVARETWQPLRELADDAALRQFAEGLEALVADRFEDCIARLELGIAANRDNPPLNDDMRLIVGRCRDAMANAPSHEDDSISPTTLLLGRNRTGRQMDRP